MKSWYLALCLSLLIFSQSADCHGQPPSAVDEEVKATTLVQTGQAAPDFTCQTSDGKTLTLSALKGKVVLLYFFSTEVAPCITEMKYLETEVQQKLRGKEDFQIIAIGRKDSREGLVTLGGEKKFTFPLVPDPTAQIYERYFTKYTPRTVVVGKKGIITYLASGYNEHTGIFKLQAALTRELTANAP